MIRKLLLPVLFLSAAASANTLNVPSQYSSIQAAITASTNGDTVVVSPGTYFENLNFRGKKIVLTSLYYQAQDTSYITSTIINGSMPTIPDSASCVIFSSGEDSTTVLQGFTLTGGTGTKWTDIHGAGTYREGGGILIELCSPTIMHNIIIYNTATNTAGVSSGGGGGIRIGDGNPLIQNNIIMYNQGIYGAGIVLNYTGVKIRNNIIASNFGGQNFYGGSAVWTSNDLGSTPKIIENNTIINNQSFASNGTGGILVWGASNVVVKNNIIWGNLPAVQVKILSATSDVSYNNFSGTVAGAGPGNITSDPLLDFCNAAISGSAAIDGGDSSAIYNDPSTGGTANFPAQGTDRNDIGAFGGPYASVMNCVESVVTAISNNMKPSSKVYIYPNPASEHLTINGAEGLQLLKICTASGSIVLEKKCSGMLLEEQIDLQRINTGFYLVKLIYNNGNETMKKLQVVQ